MTDCPACGTPLAHKGEAHCTSRLCVWLKCTACGTRIAPDLETYWGANIWGNASGYLTALNTGATNGDIGNTTGH
jgi:hypothetical protein